MIAFLGALLASLLCAHAAFFQQVRSFGFSNAPTANQPLSGLILASDGLLYGTTWSGGPSGGGTIFRLDTNGSNYSVLHTFGNGPSDGYGPIGGVIEGRDGILYATTDRGGIYGRGTIARVNKDGTGYRLLHHFSGLTNDGANPRGSLLHGSDGRLYGSTEQGGHFNWGVLYRIETNGNNFRLLHRFGTNSIDALFPISGLTEAHDGALYGAVGTAAFSDGTIYRINKDGSAYSVLMAFTNATDPRRTHGRVIQGRDGFLYGSSLSGGMNDLGTVYRVATNGSSFSVIRSLGGSVTTYWPWVSVIEGLDDALYGVASGGASVFRVSKNGGFTILHQFSGTPDGEDPRGELLQGPDGTLYGTTWFGGTAGGGTIFRISPSGTGYTALKSFPGIADPDLKWPVSGVTVGSDGHVYGTTSTGGTWDRGGIYRVPQNGTNHSVLTSFAALGATTAPLTEGFDGFLYGTAQEGILENAYGIVFRCGKDGSNTVLRNFSFDISGIGWAPMNGVIQSTNGLLYGSTSSGAANGFGSIFSLTAAGAGGPIYALTASETNLSALIEASDGNLYGTCRGINGDAVFRCGKNGVFARILTFGGTNQAAGDLPGSPILEASDGKLYGMTSRGGALGHGTLYAVNKDGTGFSIVHSFRGTQGAHPGQAGPLVEGTDGRLYGTLRNEGEFGRGSIYRIGKDGYGFTIVHSFSVGDGAGLYPRSGLTRDSEGVLYGTTVEGGLHNMGTVFRLDPREVRLGITRNLQVARLSWPATISVDQLEQSPDLTNWSAISASISTSNNIRRAQSIISGYNSFFRVRRF